tara:strand:- start:558 stop:1073 length:516 start_codon:yes stop_codon:yes gene_type:complete
MLSSCVTIHNKQVLSVDIIQNKEKVSTIHTQGIYLAEQGNEYLPMVLFDNGYFHMNFTYQENPAHQNSQYLQKLKSDSLFFPKDKKYGIWGWGIWWIEGDSILMEHYVNRVGDYDINRYRGIMTSDTSFKLMYRLGERANVDTLEFSYFATDFKPDSSNYIQMNIEEFGKK